MASLAQLIRRDLAAYPVLSGATVIGALLAVGCEVALPAALGGTVAALTAATPAGGWTLLVAALLGGAVIGSAVSVRAGTRRRSISAAARRTRLIPRILGLPVHDRGYDTGDLVGRFVTDSRAPAQLSSAVLSGITGILGGVLGLVLLATIDWWLSLVVIAELAVNWLAIRMFLSRFGDAEAGYRAAWARLGTLLLDAHHGARTIRAAGTRDRELRRVLAPLTELARAGRAALRAQRTISVQTGLLSPLREIAVLLVAGLAVTTRDLTAADLLAALGYSALALNILNQLDGLVDATRFRAGSDRLRILLDASDPRATGAGSLPPAGRGLIRFENVTVRLAGRTVLDRLSGTIPAGARVAVVGASGHGKSLLAGLPSRLIEPDHGTVRIDGVDVATVRPDQLRRDVAHAFDEPRLFGATVADAIAAGSDARPEQVRAAARAAAAEGFILRLPHGFDTPLELAPMSGGERQRIGLARALCGTARVLILDDATSSVDTATAAEIDRAIHAASRDRTTLVVTNRATTARTADLVAWLDTGRLRALAPHHTLLTDPDYQALLTLAPEPV